MNSNSKLHKSHHYLNEYINELIRDLNFHANFKLFNAYFFLNSYLYDVNSAQKNHQKFVLNQKDAPYKIDETNEKLERENDLYNSDFPKLLPFKKRWSDSDEISDAK